MGGQHNVVRSTAADVFGSAFILTDRKMTEAGGLDPEPSGGLFAVHEAGNGNAIN